MRLIPLACAMLLAAALAAPAMLQQTLSDYTETIPGSTVTFEMVAIPGGTFQAGSPESDPDRGPGEEPVRSVTVGPFWIGRTEVTWDEYEQYYFRSAGAESNPRADAVSRPTPPYGAPDQGWGRGKRPAMGMTWYAATQYCEWLSALTGKKYRLPTSDEWEYACRAGTQTRYYFGDEAAGLADYGWFRANSERKSHPAAGKKANAWGLLDMLGNVAEFCLDPWSDQGSEHVIRGGSYRSPASALRCGARESTDHDAWMAMDPQEPKSKWWYSDAYFVGFRLVRDP